MTFQEITLMAGWLQRHFMCTSARCFTYYAFSCMCYGCWLQVVKKYSINKHVSNINNLCFCFKVLNRALLIMMHARLFCIPVTTIYNRLTVLFIQNTLTFVCSDQQVKYKGLAGFLQLAISYWITMLNNINNNMMAQFKHSSHLFKIADANRHGNAFDLV